MKAMKIYSLLLFFLLPAVAYGLAITDLSPRTGDTVNVAKGLTVSISIGQSGFAVEKAQTEINGILYDMNFDTRRLLWTATLPPYAVPLGHESIEYHALDYGGNTAYLAVTVITVDQPVLEPPAKAESSEEFVEFHAVANPYVGGKIKGEMKVSLGSFVALDALPNPGFVFSEWTGDVNSSLNPISLLGDRNLTIIANFTGDLEDSDSDGLKNYEEIHIYGTSKWRKDTDGDGLTDKQEVDYGWNPLRNDRAIVDAVTEMKSLTGGSPYTMEWFFQPELGWLFTSEEIFPFLYSQSTTSWLYFQSGNENPRFYDYETRAWIVLE